MTRRELLTRVESLSRPELQRVVVELVRQFGSDAAARLIPDSPFPIAKSSSQLMLVAVDTVSVMTEIERVVAFGTSLAQLESCGIPDVGAHLNHPALRLALERRWEHLMDECRRAAEYDPAQGLAMADRTVDALVALRRATRAYDVGHAARNGTWALDVAAMLQTALPVVEAVARRLCTLAVTGEPARHLFETVAALHALAPDADAFGMLSRAFDAAPDPTPVRELLHWLESDSRAAAHTVPALSLLAARVVPDDVDSYVRVAEVFVDHDARIIADLVRCLAEHDRDDEARFWLGEGRIRHAGRASVWDDLEEEFL